MASVDAAEAALALGEGRVITQGSMRDPAAEVKQRGRTRLAGELATSLLSDIVVFLSGQTPPGQVTQDFIIRYYSLDGGGPWRGGYRPMPVRREASLGERSQDIELLTYPIERPSDLWHGQVVDASKPAEDMSHDDVQ